MGDISKYVSVLEAARLMDVSKSRVEQFIDDGRLVVEWLAGRRYVLREAAEALRDKPRPHGRPKKEKPPGEGKK